MDKKKPGYHKLKTDQSVFQAVWDREKTYEIRWFKDRDFNVGDRIELLETLYTGEQMKAGKPLEFTGRWIIVTITHVLKEMYGLKDWWCILSFRLVLTGTGNPETMSTE